MDTEIVAQIVKKTGVDSKIKRIGIITGTGLQGIASVIKNPLEISYDEIDNFPRTQVKGHPGRLVFGSIADTPVVCLQGRIHFYEGYSFAYIGQLVKILYNLGVRVLILSNAAGGLNEEYETGDVMVIKDHINLTGDNALRGIVHPEKGFPFISIFYDTELQHHAHEAAKTVPGFSQSLRNGVYSIINGPSFETVAESKFLIRGGADAAGMSTIPEVQMANYLGMRVFAFSLITNMCVRTYGEYSRLQGEPNDEVSEGVYEVGQRRMPEIVAWVTKIIEKINLDDSD